MKIRERVWTREIWRFAPSVLYVDQEKICDPPSLMTSISGWRTYREEEIREIGSLQHGQRLEHD